MERANSDTICDAILQTLSNFDEGKMIMLSMDDPTMSWVVFEKLRQHREENEMPVLFDIGSCSLHVVHSAFQVGVEATKWNVSKVFQAMRTILHDSCAKGMFAKLSIELIYSYYHFVRLVELKIKMLQLEELPFDRT